MKKTQKLFCLLLAVMMILPVLSACNKDGKTPDGTSTDEKITIAGIEKKNYGVEFTTVNPENDNYTNYYWSEDAGNSSNIAIANYEREMAIEEHLGIDIYHETLSQTEGVLYATLERCYLSGLDDYQLTFTHPFVDLVSLMNGEFLLDLSEVSSISMNDEYYNIEIMEGVEYQRHLYLGSSSMILHEPNVILFNKNVANNYEGVGEDALYQHVRDKTWTMDQMFAYAKLVDISLNETQPSEMFGTYGFVSDIDTGMCPFVTTNGYMHAYKDSDGIYQLQNFNETIFNIFKKFVSFTDSEYFYGWKFHQPETKLTMDTGRAFFSTAGLDYMIDQMTASEVPLGVLPYPTIEKGMTPKNQDYAGYFVLPASIKDPVLSGEVVELFSYYGETEIRYEFYDVLLGLRASKVPQDQEMLEYIFDNLVADPVLAFLNQGSADLSRIYYIVPFMIRDNEKAMASWYAKYYGLAKAELDKVNGLD